MFSQFSFIPICLIIKKKQYFFYSTVLFFFSHYSNSLGQDLDSINSELKIISSPSIRLSSYLKRAHSFEEKNIDLALKLAEESAKLSYKLLDTSAWIESIFLIAQCASEIGDYARALNIYQELEKKFIVSNNIEKLAEIHLFKGKIYLGLSLIERADTEYDKMIELAEANPLESLKPKAYRAIGMRKVIKGEFIEAQTYFRLALNAETEDKTHKSMMLMNLGNIKVMLNDTDSAFYFYHENYDLAKKTNNNKGLVDVCINLCRLYAETGKKRKALAYLLEGNKLATKIGFSDGISFSSDFLAKFYYNEGEFKKAYHYLNNYQKIKLKLLNKSLEEKVSILKNEIREEIAEKKITRLEYKNKQSKLHSLVQKQITILISVVAVVIICFLFIILFQLIKRKKSQKTNYLTLENKLKQKKEELDRAIKQISSRANYILEIYDITKEFSKKNPDSIYAQGLTKIVNDLKSDLNRESDWDIFQSTFGEAYPQFEKDLFKINKSLSKNDLRICTYVKSGFTQKEIAYAKNISLEGVKTSVKRVKKKLNIKNNTRLFEFLNEF